MKKYRTRSGKEVNIWTFNSYQLYFPIRGEIQETNGAWVAASWRSNLAYVGFDQTSDRDLVEVHPCDGLKPGDKVRVWSDPGTDKTFVQSFVRITREGEIASQAFGIKNAVVEIWPFGEPA